MDDLYPIIDETINPCRGCPDYDEDGCRSAGGCGRPHTSADRIRALTDEELADLFQNLCCPYSLEMGGWEGYCEIETKGCRNCWLDWLRKGGETR